MMNSLLLGAALAAIFGGPVQIGLFGIGHVEPTPQPRGSWNFTSKPFQPYSDPELSDIDARASCAYVGPKRPYKWRFAFRNRTSAPMSFDVGLVIINKTRLATVRQVYSTVDPDSVRHVRIPAGASGQIIEAGRLGCPGMQGGETGKRHYVVMVDNVREGSRLVRHGVIAAYNAAVDEERADYNIRVGDAVSAGMQAGLESQEMLLNNLQASEVPY